MAGALSHLKVLDLTRILAGPWCTQMLADLGADVIKVERPHVGDDTRHWGPPWVDDGEEQGSRDSSYFTSTNRNKRSVAIDIANAAGQALVRELVKLCDVLVENYKVGDLARYGLSYEDVKAINPQLIYCSITGYGQDGPFAHRPGYDFIFQGEGGLMSITGEREGKSGGGPMRSAIAVTDVLTGLNATIGVMAALESRNITGMGQHVDLALLDTIVSFGATQIAGYFASGVVPGRLGNEHPNLVPYQTFGTSDGHIIVACGNDGQFRELCELIGRIDLVGDPRYRNAAARSENRIPLINDLTALFKSMPTAHWLTLLADASVPTGSISNYQQVFEHPQVIHRKLRVDLERPNGKTLSTVANPVRLSETPVSYRYPPPRRGQHTHEVLSTLLHLTSDQINTLQADAVIETAAR